MAIAPVGAIFGAINLVVIWRKQVFMPGLVWIGLPMMKDKDRIKRDFLSNQSKAQYVAGSVLCWGE
jgi:hypothetical protein